MVKEVERAGIPVVHICTVTPISMTVGANRIVPAIAIPHPLGNPALDKDEEKALRRKIVEKALSALETEVEGQTIFDQSTWRGVFEPSAKRIWTLIEILNTQRGIVELSMKIHLQVYIFELSVADVTITKKEN